MRYGLLETGLRVSELAGLNKQQIQWQQGAIRIKGKGGPYGKKSKVRVIPMSRRLKPLLENFFVLNDKFPWTPRTIQRLMKRIAYKAGITKPLTPHVLRHTFSVFFGFTRAAPPAPFKGFFGHDHLCYDRNLFEYEPGAHPAGVPIEVVSDLTKAAPCGGLDASRLSCHQLSDPINLVSSRPWGWERVLRLNYRTKGRDFQCINSM